MKTTFYLFGAVLSAFFFAVPLQSQILQWERFLIADSAYDATVSRLTKTRFGLFTNVRNEQVLFSHDKGRSWQKAKWNGLGETAIFSGNPYILDFQESPTKLFTQIPYLCFSADSGKTWETVPSTLANMPAGDILVLNNLVILDTVLFALRNNNVYRSYDDGKTWKYMDFFVNAADTSGGFSAFFVDNIKVEDGVLILFTRNFWDEGRRLISYDKGSTWRFDDGIPLPAEAKKTSYVRLQENLFLAVRRYEQNNSVFFNHWLSRDSGKTWQTFSLLDSKDYISGHIVIGSTLFLATTQGIFTTSDKGETWQKESGIGVLPDARFSYFTLDGNTLYAAVYEKGVYRANVSTITSVSSSYNQGFMVYSPAPNPSSDYTDLTFTLPRAAQAGVTLYSTLGTEVWRSESATMSAGEQHIRIDTRHLPTGVYAYRLTVEGVSSVGRIVVVR